MRFREFAPRKRNRDQQVDEVLPALALAPMAAGALARGAAVAGGAALRTGAKLGGAALKAAAPLAKKVGSAVASGAKKVGTAVGQANKALFTPQGYERQMGSDPAAGQQAPPVQIKPGVKILHPGIGQTKIKSIQGKDAVLDTQKELGQDVRVDQNELLAILGQGQQQK